jgi:hypothetical protein
MDNLCCRSWRYFPTTLPTTRAHILCTYVRTEVVVIRTYVICASLCGPASTHPEAVLGLSNRIMVIKGLIAAFSKWPLGFISLSTEIGLTVKNCTAYSRRGFYTVAVALVHFLKQRWVYTHTHTAGLLY